MAAITEDRDVRFKRPPEGDLHANLFAPPEDATDRRNTVVLHVHGGVWNRGEREFFDDRCRALAARGIPTATIDYRLSGTATYPAALQDVKTAIRWVRTGDAFDRVPDRIVLVAHSAGAHLAALAATTQDHGGDLAPDDAYGDASTAVDGIVCFDGPYDLMGAEPGGETADFVGCDPTENPDRYRAASPRERVTSEHPPALLYHADDDEWLTRRETRAYRDVLACEGVDVELKTPPGDHWFFTEPPWFDRTVEHAVTFVDELDD
ncbi:alpha/beta hydrolase [Halorubellus salinus]|uniref:alpha/beta hydrolase n=1 Tax=Halorubellus salinus TaxID=755309 RepID=UPI001D07BF8D|nr:alpha/beta hydrolase [Halorubellus salinus]